MTTTLGGARPAERIGIVDKNNNLVRLNDKDRTYLRFDTAELPRARHMLERLNNYPDSLLAPYRIAPLTGLYNVLVLKEGLVYDRQTHVASEMSITTYIHEMMKHGYDLDIRFSEEPVGRTL